MELIFISQPQRIAGETTDNRYNCRARPWGSFPSIAPRKIPVNHLPLRTRSGTHHHSYPHSKLFFFGLYNLFLIRHSYEITWFMFLGAAKDLSKSGEESWFYPKAISLQFLPQTSPCWQPTPGRFMFSQMKSRKSLWCEMKGTMVVPHPFFPLLSGCWGWERRVAGNPGHQQQCSHRGNAAGIHPTGVNTSSSSLVASGLKCLKK